MTDNETPTKKRWIALIVARLALDISLIAAALYFKDHMPMWLLGLLIIAIVLTSHMFIREGKEIRRRRGKVG